MIHVLQISHPQDIRKIMQDIQVDAFGIKIMLPKALTYLLRINSLSNISANILKQEMLSLGGDAAIARGALTGKTKKTDCILMGNFSQFNRLNEKLSQQPFGLNRVAADLSTALTAYQRDKFTLDLGRYKLNLNRRTLIMGIVNLTPDSFSGDGLYKKGQSPSLDCVRDKSGTVPFVEQLVKDGADMIDLGGESSRPGAKPVPLKEELTRTIPVIRLLAKKIKVPISIDTYKPEVARQALDNGEVIVNDITGLRNSKLAKVVAKYKAGVVIMHMKGKPRTMQNNPKYISLMDEIMEYLHNAINTAVSQGIDKEKLIIDPGIGFGKTLTHNLEILNNLNEFKVLGRPILVGPSRKSFIGKILNVGPNERIFGASTSLSANGERNPELAKGHSRTIGTVSTCILAAKSGAKILRVHDVKAVKQALKVFDAINRTV